MSSIERLSDLIKRRRLGDLMKGHNRIVAIGKHGGKIVGYGPGHKPIYQKTGEAHSGYGSKIQGLQHAIASGMGPGTVRKWHGAEYARHEDGSWHLSEGDSASHSPRLMSGHRIGKEGGHQLAVMPGAKKSETENFLNDQKVGAVVRTGYGFTQAVYVKHADGWVASKTPGAPYSPSSSEEIAAAHHASGKKGLFIHPETSVEQATKLASPSTELPALEQRVRRAEATIINHPHERLMAFREDSSLSYHREGFRASVQVQPEHIGKMKDAVLTHNHPGSGNSLSPQDVLMALNADAASIRAVGVNSHDEMYLHEVRRPKGGWHELVPAIQKAMPAELIPQLMEVPKSNRMTAALSALVQLEYNGVMMVAQQEKIHGSSTTEPDLWHKVWQGLSKRIGLDYRRENVK